MCKVFKVSRSGYYSWKRRPPSRRKIENVKILNVAKKSYRENRGIYGLDKLLEDVREEYPECSRNRLYKTLIRDIIST